MNSQIWRKKAKRRGGEAKNIIKKNLFISSKKCAESTKKVMKNLNIVVNECYIVMKK